MTSVVIGKPTYDRCSREPELFQSAGTILNQTQTSNTDNQMSLISQKLNWNFLLRNKKTPFNWKFSNSLCCVSTTLTVKLLYTSPLFSTGFFGKESWSAGHILCEESQSLLFPLGIIPHLTRKTVSFLLLMWSVLYDCGLTFILHSGLNFNITTTRWILFTVYSVSLLMLFDSWPRKEIEGRVKYVVIKRTFKVRSWGSAREYLAICSWNFL